MVRRSGRNTPTITTHTHTHTQNYCTQLDRPLLLHNGLPIHSWLILEPRVPLVVFIIRALLVDHIMHLALEKEFFAHG